jgi:predicted negative regulator of RcsB-dependent stress response
LRRTNVVKKKQKQQIQKSQAPQDQAPIHTEERDPVVKALDWMKSHRNPLVAAATILVVLAASAWFMVTAQQRKEAFAAAALSNARAIAEAGNLALAASDLSQLARTYGGTPAGEEAVILLAQIRLSEGQTETAIEELNGFIESRPSDQFRAAAYGLLGNSLDQAGRYTEAADAFRNAATAAWYDFLRAEYLIEKGRVLELAGDTSAAVATYEEIITNLSDETESVTEARVRLAELRPGHIAIGT